MKAAVLFCLLCLSSCVFAFQFGMKNVQTPQSKRAPADACTIVGCRSVNENCEPDITSVPVKAWTCNGNTYCNTTCMNTRANGGFCDSSDQCQSDRCSGGQCTEARRENGATCTTDDQCESNICTSSRCSTRANGETCNGDNQCGETSWCDTTCKASIALGSACSRSESSSQQCAGVAICGYSATCVLPFSVNAAGNCDSAEECNDGTACISNVCTASASSTNKACNTTSDCATNENCGCNYNTGYERCTAVYTNIPAGGRSSINSLNSCLTSKCGSGLTETCALASCKKEYCAYGKLILDYSLASFGNFLPDCAATAARAEATSEYNAICSGSDSSDSATVVASVAAVVVGAAALLM